jgi:hypothetical protein
VLPLPLDGTPFAFAVDGEGYMMVRGPAWPGAGYVRLGERTVIELLEGWRHGAEGRLLRRLCLELGLESGERLDHTDATATLAGRLLLEHLDDIALFHRACPPLATVAPDVAMADLAELEPQVEPDDRPEPDADHWIHITFLDEALTPLAGVDCRIALPDGRIHQGRTDRDGVLWVERIAKPGACALRGTPGSPASEPAAMAA